MLLAASCKTFTWTGGNFYYPPGSTHETADYHLEVYFEGARGKAYVDRTEKKIWLVIRQGDVVLLGDRHYAAVAADLHCAVRWERYDDLEVLFFDGPDGTTVEQGVHPGERLILTLHFRFDSTSQKFTEVPMPSDVTRRDNDPIRRPTPSP